MTKLLQKAFDEFHSKIKIDFDDNAILIQKRELLIAELQAFFKKKHDDGGAKITFRYENQGSYSMKTGIEPLEGQDYDIDVMLLFDISKSDYTAKEVKKWVYDALVKYPRNVNIMKPCVRVQYHSEGEIHYHVDLAVYSDQNSDGITYLSKKPQNANDDEVWEKSEPKKLKEKINDKFKIKEERHQFKRVIRYIKRWKDENFKVTKDGKPTGIAITALAYNGFVPNVKYDSFSETYTSNDLAATKAFVNYFIDHFGFLSDDIEVKLPVEPYNNLFKKMTSSQKTTLKDSLKKLKEKLIESENESDPHEASKILNHVFGDDFPILPKEKTGQSRPRSIASSPDQA
jgi:hypothetical protein